MEPKSPPKKKTKTSASGAEGDNHNGRDDSADDVEPDKDAKMGNSDPPAYQFSLSS